MRDRNDFRSRRETRNQTSTTVETIASAYEVDRAIAKLVLALGTDPVARWIYDSPHEYLLHIPRLFRALGASSFEAGAAQCTSDGHGVALWLPPGIRGDDGPLEAVLAESVAGEKEADVALRDDRALPANRAALVPVADRCRSVAPEQGVRGYSAAARPSPMRSGAPSGISLVLEHAEYFLVPQAWLRDRGYDPGRLVALHLPDAAPAALKGQQKAKRGHRCAPYRPKAGYGCNH